MLMQTYPSEFQESVLHINIRSAPLWIESITDSSTFSIHVTVLNIIATASFDFLFMNSSHLFRIKGLGFEGAGLGWAKEKGEPRENYRR